MVELLWQMGRSSRLVSSMKSFPGFVLIVVGLHGEKGCLSGDQAQNSRPQFGSWLQAEENYRSQNLGWSSEGISGV